MQVIQLDRPEIKWFVDDMLDEININMIGSIQIIKRMPWLKCNAIRE